MTGRDRMGRDTRPRSDERTAFRPAEAGHVEEVVELESNSEQRNPARRAAARSQAGANEKEHSMGKRRHLAVALVAMLAVVACTPAASPSPSSARPSGRSSAMVRL